MIFYINSVNFATATTAYMDILLTIVAPDGYYSDGSSYRRQLYGELVDIFPCPSIDTVSITNINVSGATFNGNLISNGGDLSAVRGFVYGTSINPTIANNVVTDTAVGTGVYAINVTGITVDVTYYVRAYSIVFGDTIYGDQLSFKIIPLAVVMTIGDTSCFESICQLNGNIDPITVYNLTGTAVPGDFIYTTSALTTPYTTVKYVKKGTNIMSVGEFGELSLECSDGAGC